MERFTKITDVNGEHIITRDNQTGLEWAARDIGEYANKLANSEAEKACSELGLGGHEDWRLPTIDELRTLIDQSKGYPAIDTDAFPDIPNEYFWSSTPDENPQSMETWGVDFELGESSTYYDFMGGFVLPVRGPIALALKEGV